MMDDILSTYYKRIISATIHKLYVFGPMLKWAIFLVSVYRIRAQILSAPFSYNLYIRQVLLGLSMNIRSKSL
jgi:hypothetical protein